MHLCRTVLGVAVSVRNDALKLLVEFEDFVLGVLDQLFVLVRVVHHERERSPRPPQSPDDLGDVDFFG